MAARAVAFVHLSLPPTTLTPTHHIFLVLFVQRASLSRALSSIWLLKLGSLLGHSSGDGMDLLRMGGGEGGGGRGWRSLHR